MGADLFLGKPDFSSRRGFKVYMRDGYFRDSYNAGNLFWAFGLSWWKDVIPMLDADGLLHADGIESLAKMLRVREPVFEKFLADPERCDDPNYFKRRYSVFKRFLHKAMKLGEPIYCSL